MKVTEHTTASGNSYKVIETSDCITICSSLFDNIDHEREQYKRVQNVMYHILDTLNVTDIVGYIDSDTRGIVFDLSTVSKSWRDNIKTKIMSIAPQEYRDMIRFTI